MAKLERGAKSNAVREYLAAHPEAGPTEVVKALGEKNITVTAALVSNLKSGKSGKKAKTTKKARKSTNGRKARASATSNGFTLNVTEYLAFRGFAKQHGGYEKAIAGLTEAAKVEAAQG